MLAEMIAVDDLLFSAFNNNVFLAMFILNFLGIINLWQVLPWQSSHRRDNWPVRVKYHMGGATLYWETKIVLCVMTLLTSLWGSRGRWGRWQVVGGTCGVTGGAENWNLQHMGLVYEAVLRWNRTFPSLIRLFTRLLLACWIIDDRL